MPVVSVVGGALSPDWLAALRRMGCAVVDATVETASGLVVLSGGLAQGDPVARHWRVLNALVAVRGQAERVVILQQGGVCAPDLRSAFAGGLTGLAKTAAREWESDRVRAVDVGLNADADRLAVAMLDPDLPVEVAVAGAEICVPVELDLDLPGTRGGAVSGQDVFLVTGGARGVTADCVVALARASGAAFVLAGRSALAEWPQGLARTDDAKLLRSNLIARARAAGRTPVLKEIDAEARSLLAGQEIRATLDAISAAGGRSIYVAADLSTREGVARALQAARPFGAVSGLVHGAGVLADKRLEDKTEAQVTRVFGPKVGGLALLLDAIDPAQLRHVALFSSVAARYGNVGQADYAMANEILNRAAHALKAACPQAGIISMNWGPWDGGMVDASLREHFIARGVDLIPRAEGAEVFARLLCEGALAPVEVLVGGGLGHG